MAGRLLQCFVGVGVLADRAEGEVRRCGFVAGAAASSHPGQRAANGR